MQQKSDQQPDFFQVLRQQHGNSMTYMRFYIQEDKYRYNPFYIKSENEVTIHQGKIVELSLPLCRFIYDTVTDVLIGNKFVYSNSKIMNSVMESGKQMILSRYVKKHFSWLAFMNRPEFSMVKTAYQSLNEADQSILEFTVLAVSNLVLKLGINISKLSCILTQRKYTTKFLSIPTLSLIFLQSLMHTLFSSKEISWQDQEGKSQFIRQFPKITYIKISEILNKQELLLMEFGEQVFFTSQTIRKIKNMQYLQFYEHEDNKGSQDYQRITGYEYIHSINLSELISQGSPYGFELLFLFRTVYFNVIKDFNPDVIIFVEDYESTKKIIEPEIRALILAQMMENITGKVFVMREVGFKWDEQTNLLGPIQFDISSKPKNIEIDIEDFHNEHVIRSSPKREYHKIEEQNYRRNAHYLMEGITPYESEKFLIKLAESIPKMSKELQQKLDKEELHKIHSAKIVYQQNIKSPIGRQNYFSKVESILRDDLQYIALALIQRSSFQETAIKSHQYIYEKKFISNLINKISQLTHQTEPQTELYATLNVSKNQLKSMLENIELETLVYFKNYYDSVYVFPLKMSFQLRVPQEKEPLKYYDEDFVQVYYGKNDELLVFLFRLSALNFQEGSQNQKEIAFGRFKQTTVLLRLCVPDFKQLENYYFDKIFEEEAIFQGYKIENSTYLITENYIYRAFGSERLNKNQQSKQKSSIFRAEYRNIMNSFNKTSKSMQNQMLNRPTNILKWIEFSSCMPLFQKTQIPLMQKEYGWVVYDPLSKTALFAGGYAPNGESRVNKYMHTFWEKNRQIRQMGKTSSQIFEGAKHPKAKIALFPFIYGIPFIVQQKNYILNTNGFFQCFTNCNKLFLTEMKLSQDPNDSKQGILSQRKLFVNYQDEDQRLRVVATKELVVHFIVKGYRMVNTYQNKCLLQTLDDGMIIMELVRIKRDSRQILELSISTDRPEQNGEKFPILQFMPYDLEKK